MGWGSASSIFDVVADALIAAGASDELKLNTLSPLIKELRDGDWDTWDESMDRYAGDSVIMQAFRASGCYTECDDEGPGRVWCRLEEGHEGDHGTRGVTWPQSVAP